jgi:hypothetical protein
LAACTGFGGFFLLIVRIGSGLTDPAFPRASAFPSSFLLVSTAFGGRALRPLLLDLGLRRCGLGRNRRLLGDLADGVVDRLGFGDFGQRFRFPSPVFMPAMTRQAGRTK